MVPETHMKFCVTEQIRQKKSFCPQNLGKWANNGEKKGFLILFKIFPFFTEFVH